MQLQLLLNRVVRILDGCNVSAVTDAGTVVQSGNDMPRGAPSLPPNPRPVALCRPPAPVILALTASSDTGLIFFAARVLVQGGGGFSGGVKSAAELLNVLLQPQNQHSDQDSSASRFPSLCVLSLDLNSNIGLVDPAEAAHILLPLSASPPLNVTLRRREGLSTLAALAPPHECSVPRFSLHGAAAPSPLRDSDPFSPVSMLARCCNPVIISGCVVDLCAAHCRCH